MNENAYGILKRLNFLIKQVEKYKPKNVLEIGCGTGNLILLPLAERFPETQFIGLDEDEKSTKYANEINHLSNLKFVCAGELDLKKGAEFIIASEVMEHVKNPQEFLSFLKDSLAESGKLVLTVPNGYGPYEIATFVDNLLYFSGIYYIPRKIRNKFLGKPSPLSTDQRDTLAVSPHINFFSYGHIRKLINGLGFNILEWSSRTFLCGFGFDYLLRWKWAVDWNIRMTDCVPAYLNSGWMFVLEKGNLKTDTGYKPVSFDKSIRRYLNQKRWGRC